MVQIEACAFEAGSNSKTHRSFSRYFESLLKSLFENNEPALQRRGATNVKTTAQRVCHILIVFLALGFANPAISADPSTNQTDRERSFSSELTAGWHFVRTPNPNAGADAISIMHTADTSKSDLDFAGLMFRCREGGTEAVIVLLKAFPIRAKPHVVLGAAGKETKFEATIAAPGTAVLLPGDAATLVEGPWRAQDSLALQIDDGQSTIRGVVPLTGLQAAFKVLVASCRIQ